MVVLTSLPPPSDGIRHQQSLTSCHINTKELGKGTLYIAESRVSWVNDGSGTGFSLEYPHIALHAVSRDLSAYPHECLYLMIDAQLEEPEPTEGGENSGSDEADSAAEMTEIRFIPDDKTILDVMFHTMSECQALHPDPQDALSEDEDEGMFEDAEEGDYELGQGDQACGDGFMYGSGVGDGGHGDNDNGDVDGREEEEAMETGQFDDAEPDQ